MSKRTTRLLQVAIPQEQHSILQQLALDRNTTIADLIRPKVDAILMTPKGRKAAETVAARD